jgi:hypothetical protein
MRLYRQVFAASELLKKRVAVDKVIELTKAVTGNTDSGLDVADAGAAVMASELYEPRQAAFAKNEFLTVPNVPRPTLSAILRGRIEELAGWALYQKGDFADATIRLRRAISVLPAKSAWWRSSMWRLGASLAAEGKDAEALNSYIESYKTDRADANKYAIVEGLYKKVNGSVDGLQQKLGAQRVVGASTDAQQAPAEPRGVTATESAAETKVEDTKLESAGVSNEPKPRSTPALSREIFTPSESRKANIIPEATPAAESKKELEKVAEETKLPSQPVLEEPKKEPEETKVPPQPVLEEPKKEPEKPVMIEPAPQPTVEAPEETKTPPQPVLEEPKKEPEKAPEETKPPPQPVLEEPKKEPEKAPDETKTVVTEPKPVPAVEPTVEQPKKEPEKTSEETPLASDAKPIPKTDTPTEHRTATTEHKLTGAKPLFEPIIIKIPDSRPKKPDPIKTQDTTDEKPGDTTGTARPRVIEGYEVKIDPPPPCLIGASQDNISLINDGGSVGLLMNVEAPGEMKELNGVSSSPKDIEVTRQPEISGMPTRRFFVIKSVSPTTGDFTVSFVLPCGRKDITVTVR